MDRDLSQIAIGVCLYCWRCRWTRPISHRDFLCEGCDERSVTRNRPDLIWVPWKRQLELEARARMELADLARRNAQRVAA